VQKQFKKALQSHWIYLIIYCWKKKSKAVFNDIRSPSMYLAWNDDLNIEKTKDKRKLAGFTVINKPKHSPTHKIEF